MPSRRLRIVNILSSMLLRPLLRRTRDPRHARRDLLRLTRFALRMPAAATMTEKGGIAWIEQDRRNARPVILYFHGGGYIAGAPETHRAMLARLARLTGLAVAAPRYRLAPEHPAPAAFEDARRAHRALLDKGVQPRDIVLGGDSAGGGLALALLAHLCAEDLRPAGCFAFSPWTDLTVSGASMQRNARRDRLLPAERLDELLRYVIPDVPGDDPRISPLFAGFDAPPPVLLQVAATEILVDDSHRMADVLRRAGGVVVVDEMPDAPHVWQMMVGYVPEADASLSRVAEFIRGLTSPPPSEDES